MRRRRVSIVRVIAPILIIWVLSPTALLAQAPPAPRSRVPLGSTWRPLPSVCSWDAPRSSIRDRQSRVCH